MQKKNTMNLPDDSNANYYENLKLHLKAMEVGLWEYDIDSDTVSCDSGWYDLLGCEQNSIHRIADFRPFIHPQDVEMATSVDYESVMAMIATDQRYHIDFRVIRPDGETRWWRSVACLLIDPANGHRRAVGCVTDNTDFRLIDPRPPGEAPEHQADQALTDPAEIDGSATKDEATRTALSAKELECLNWVSVGKTAWETAIIMDRSQRTVEFHLVNAMRKLGAANKIHAVVIAVRNGLI